MADQRRLSPDTPALYLGRHLSLQLNSAARAELIACLEQVNATDQLSLAFGLVLPDGREVVVEVEDSDHWEEGHEDEPYGDISTARDHDLAAAVRHHVAAAAETLARTWRFEGAPIPSQRELIATADRLAGEAVAGWRAIEDDDEELVEVEAFARHEALTELTSQPGNG
jgi:hypothetical protein